MKHDIDTIVELVRARLPNVHVVQMNKKFPSDDDGLWWFRLPGVKQDIQIESSTWNIPFLVEADDMKSSSDALRLTDTLQIATYITKFLLEKANTPAT